MVLLALSMASAARAQTGSVLDASGFQLNRDYLALQPWESIDTATGNIILSFTDLELPGNAKKPIRFRRTFNNMSTAGGPWTFSVGDLPLKVQLGNGVSVGEFAHLAVWWEQLVGPKFQMPDGSLQKTMFMSDPVTTSQSTIDNTMRWAQTASLWRFDRLYRTLYLPDGTVAQYDAAGRLLAFDNGFSDTVTLAWDEVPGHLIVRQTLAHGQTRTVDVEVAGVDAFPTRMTYEDRLWRYDRDAVGRVGYVQPPMGNRWEFTYDGATLGGRILQVRTPQGGLVTYAYGSFSFLTAWEGQTPIYTPIETLSARTANSLDGSHTWEFDYTISGHDGAAAGMIAYLPDGSRIDYGYSPTDEIHVDGWVYDGRIVYDTDGVTQLEIEYREYTALRAARPNRTFYKSALKQRTISRLGKTYTTLFTYNPDTASYHDFHNPIQVFETGGELSRTTVFAYEHHSGLSPYVVGLRKREETTVSGQDTLIRSWTYDPSTGFNLTETSYGLTTTFTPEVIADLQTGNILALTKANGSGSSFEYSWGLLATSTTSEGVVTARAINPNGTVASETIAGRTTSFTYDRMLRQITKRPPGSAAVTVVTTPDDSTGRSVSVTRGPSTIVTTLDGFGRAIRTENMTNGIKTRVAYDGLGRVSYRSYPFTGSFGGGTDIGTNYTYDSLGRVLLEKNPDETAPNDSVRQHVYDGNEDWVRDEEGRWTRYTRQAFGHPDDNRLTGVYDAKEQQWTYEYNTAGNLVRVTAPDNLTRRWTYDSRNLLIVEDQPESGITRYTDYDEAGVLKERQDANGQVTIFEHDTDNRVTEIKSGTQLTTITYEPGSNNRRSSTTGPVDSRFYYDDAGRLSARDDVIEGRTYTRRFEYDGLDNLRYVRYPSGRYVEYNYDGSSRVSSVNDLTAGRAVASGFQFHPSGGITSYQAGNGLTTTIGYKPNRYWVNSISVGALQLSYEYYPAGSIKKIIDNARPDRTQEYTYDEVDRLRTTTSATLPAETFAYDAHGNRVGGQYDYWDNTNRLRRFDIHEFSYDANGNLKTVGPSIRMNYTPDNMMADITVGGVTNEYVYDSDQWRVLKAGPGTTTHFLRGAKGELLTELTDTGTGTLDVRDYINNGSRVLAVVSSSIPGSFCRATLNPPRATIGPAATPITVTVTVGPGCPWTATSTSPWATITGGGSGSGNGTVNISVAPNTGTDVRFTQVMIAGRPFAIEQAGGAGIFGDTLMPGQGLNPGEFITSENGFFKFLYAESGLLAVTDTEGGSSWNNGRLDPGGRLEMQHDGNLVLYVGGVARWATNTASAANAGARLVMQNDRNLVLYSDPAAGPVRVLWASYSQCLYTLTPSAFQIASAGGPKTVSVATEPGCPWVTSSPVPWMTVAPSSGVGDRDVTVSISANSSYQGRAAALTIANQEVPVEQWGLPGVVPGDTLQPGQKLWPNQLIKVGEYELKMTPFGNLTLTASTGTYWNTATAGPSIYDSHAEMRGDGRLALTTPAGNTYWTSTNGPSPNAYLQLHSDGSMDIHPAGGGASIYHVAPPSCTFDVWPKEVVHGPWPPSETTSILVGTQPGCQWTATSSASWITITQVDEAFVTYQMSENSGGTRVGTLTVAGQTVTITQGGVRGISDHLLPGEELWAGQMLVSPSGQYELIYQSDGNLVLYRDGGIYEWDIRRGGTYPGFAVMQGDGNFVVYNSFMAVMFQTGTAGQSGASMWLQDDGNLVIYKDGEAVWDRFSAGVP